MQFPLTFWDVSSILAVLAIVLLVTSELMSQHFGRTRFAIQKKVLKRGAIIFSFAFLFTVIVRVAELI